MEVFGQSGQKTQFCEALQKVEAMTPKERAQMRVDSYNREQGHLDETTGGYNCPKCLNRGDFAAVEERNGAFYEVYPECSCMKVRRSIWRIMDSGLAKSIKEQSLKTFTVKEPWQQTMLDKARDYVANGAGTWFYAGGQPGSGKTHICTGIARELLYSGKELQYVVWEEVAKKLKALMNEPEYAVEMRKLQESEVLYIDDLFKPVRDDFGVKPPSAADIRLAFELLNYRYVNRLQTIISSEKYLSEIMDIDEALGSRIYERAKYSVNIGRDVTKNHRRIDEELL